MPAKSAHPYVAVLYRDRVALCSPASAQPLELKFSDASIKDLEIVNQTELENQVKVFTAAHQLHPGELIIVLSDKVTFEKDLSKVPGSERTAQSQAFLDSVPLSSTSHKIFRYQNMDKLVVINRNFYDGLKRSFEILGFAVTAVIPGFMLGEIGAQDSTSSETCRILSKKADFIRANSFLSEEGSAFHQKETKFLKKYQLLVVLFFFLAVAGAVFAAFYTLRKPPLPVKKTVAPVVRPTAKPALPSATPTQAEASPSALTVQILNSSGTPGLAASIQKQLTPAGYSSITVGNATASSSQSFVLFSSRVSSKLRQSVLQLLAIASSRDNPAPEFDIIITLGKQTTP